MPSHNTHYELEEKMGDGSWKLVWDTKEAARDEPLSPLRFLTKQVAEEFVAAGGNGRGWSPGSVRLVRVEVSRQELRAWGKD